jgi:hypothetical protein
MLVVKSSSNLVIKKKNSHGQHIAKCVLEANIYKLGVTHKQENKIKTN